MRGARIIESIWRKAWRRWGNFSHGTWERCVLQRCAGLGENRMGRAGEWNFPQLVLDVIRKAYADYRIDDADYVETRTESYLSGGTGTGRKRSRSAYSSKWNNSLTGDSLNENGFDSPLICAYGRIYQYCPSFHPGTPFCWHFKKYALQHVYQSACYEKFSSWIGKIPWYIWRYMLKVLLCTRFREREQRCFDILTERRRNSNVFLLLLAFVSFLKFPVSKRKKKKLPKTFGRYADKVLTFAPAFKEVSGVIVTLLDWICR